jgi:Arc/MetJ family transcription regulator
MRLTDPESGQPRPLRFQAHALPRPHRLDSGVDTGLFFIARLANLLPQILLAPVGHDQHAPSLARIEILSPPPWNTLLGQALALHTRLCRLPHMATNLAIDDRLLDEALRVGGQRTKKDTVTQALQEFVQRRKQARILDLFGKVDFDPKYDYKRQRRRS